MPPGSLHLLVRSIGQVDAFRIRDGDRLGLIFHSGAHLVKHGIRATVVDTGFAVGAEPFKCDCVQALRVRDRQGPPEQGVDEAECGGAGADAESQRQDGRGGGHLAFHDLAQAEDRIGTERIEPHDELEVAALFAMPQQRAEGSTGFVRIAAPGDGFGDMRLELFVDLAVQAVPAKQVSDARPSRHDRSLQSARSILTGSMRMAWNTAGSAASSAATRMVSDGITSISGSPGFTW